MSVAYVAEFRNAVSPIGTYAAPALPTPPLAVQQVSFSATAGVSNAFGANTYAIYIVTNADAVLRFSPAGTTAGTSGATASSTVDFMLPSKVPWVFAVPPGGIVSAVAA